MIFNNLNNINNNEMKSIKLFTYILVVLFILGACEENAIDPLTGIYPVPEKYKLNNLFTQNSLKQTNGSRIFTLKMASEGVVASYDQNTLSYIFSGTGSYLSIDFVGKEYFLKEGTYAIAENSNAKVGNYVAGYDSNSGGIVSKNKGSCFFDVVNGSATGRKVKSGNILVNATGNNYSISGTVTLEDKTVVRIEFSGKIIYEPDPYVPNYTYIVDVQTPALGGAQGTTPIEGTTKYKLTIYADNVMYAHLEIVLDKDARSLSGNYAVKDGLNAAGQLANGYYFDWAWYGSTGILEGGSYYIDGDKKMYLREGKGGINIVDSNGNLTITGSNLSLLNVDELIASKGANWAVLKATGSINIQNAKKN